MTAVTGQEYTTDELYKAGAKIMTLQRANTARGMTDEAGAMGTNDFRNIHDVYTEWPFTKDPDISPCSPKAPTRWTRTISRPGSPWSTSASAGIPNWAAPRPNAWTTTTCPT